MEPTIHDIGRPTIRSSRPIPPREEKGEQMREGEGAAAKALKAEEEATVVRPVE